MNAGANGIFSNPGTYWGTTDDAIPTTKPPTTAPSRLSNPPRVMAAKPKINVSCIMLEPRPRPGAVNTPATVPTAAATIAEMTNVLLLRGMIGKPGAGVCPVRGHSNVQGDRTMGIWEQAPESFLAALDARFGITSPRKHGYDTVEAIRAMRDGRASVFVGMGGNFASATPDTEVTEAARAAARALMA